MSGTEPSLRWRAFNEAIISVAEELGVELVVTLGALLADVPHTRPVAVTGFASDDVARRPPRLPALELRGPDRRRRRAAPRVPAARHAVGEPVGVGAALRGRRAEPEGGARADPRLRGRSSAWPSTPPPLEEAAAEYERQVNDAVASDPDVKAFVEQLEERMDDVQDDGLPDRLPSADSIARDFQRYLQGERGPLPRLR